MNQQEELIGVMSDAIFDQNKQISEVYTLIGIVLQFVVTSQIATPLQRAEARGRSAYNVARTDGDA